MNSCDRRVFMEVLGTNLITSLAHGTSSSSSPVSELKSSKVKPLLEPFNYGGVRLLEGMQKKQYEATRNFYFNLSNDDILNGFRRKAGLPAPGHSMGGWCSQTSYVVFGQWLSGMARMYKATGDQPMLQKATYLMEEWAGTLEPGHYLAGSQWPAKAHYAYDKTVCGLVDLYEYGGQKEALPVLEQLTDWAIKNLDRTRKNPSARDRDDGATEWYTLSENLYRAYLLTGDRKYKDFGDIWRYYHYWGMFTGRIPLQPQGLHAYSHVNTLSSAAMTYAVTGDPEYLNAIVSAYDYFEKNQFFATGGYGPGENLIAPNGSLGQALETESNTFETPCGSWAGFKLARYLMIFTGKARYGDWIEKLLYNGIGAALPMAKGGKTFYYSDYRLGGGRKIYFPDLFPCCSGTYIQDVADYHNIIYFKDRSGLYVNLFVPSEVTWNHLGQYVKLQQETRYPESDTTTLTVLTKQAARFALRFRVPEWCQGATASVNGLPSSITARPGTWAAIERTWNPGDQVTINLPMQLRLAPIDKQHPHRVAIMCGPVVLVQENEALRVRGTSDPGQWITATPKSLQFQTEAVFLGTLEPFYRVGTKAPRSLITPYLYELPPGYAAPYRMYFDLES